MSKDQFVDIFTKPSPKFCFGEIIKGDNVRDNHFTVFRNHHHSQHHFILFKFKKSTFPPTAHRLSLFRIEGETLSGKLNILMDVTDSNFIINIAA